MFYYEKSSWCPGRNRTAIKRLCLVGSFAALQFFYSQFYSHIFRSAMTRYGCAMGEHHSCLLILGLQVPALMPNEAKVTLAQSAFWAVSARHARCPLIRR